jgi:hypothetical protein
MGFSPVPPTSFPTTALQPGTLPSGVILPPSQIGAGDLQISGALGGASLSNFRFFAPQLVMTDASGYSQFNFPVPFANACWYVDATPAGDFGYSFNWGVVSWTKDGVRLRAGEPSTDAIIASTALTVKLMAVGY